MAQELIDKIRAAAQAKNSDPDVAVLIAQSESGLNPKAGAKTSSAKGLFQVVDKTWSGFGGKPGKQFDPDENIRVGTDVIARTRIFCVSTWAVIHGPRRFMLRTFLVLLGRLRC